VQEELKEELQEELQEGEMLLLSVEGVAAVGKIVDVNDDGTFDVQWWNKERKKSTVMHPSWVDHDGDEVFKRIDSVPMKLIGHDDKCECVCLKAHRRKVCGKRCICTCAEAGLAWAMRCGLGLESSEILERFELLDSGKVPLGVVRRAGKRV
jgi:hypothetical protein